MTMTFPQIQILFLLLLLTLSLRRTSAVCQQSCSTTTVPYPFGFSTDCLIPLNCSTTTSSTSIISIADFSIRTLTSNSILLNLDPNCNRSITSLLPLFNSSRNYAPTSTNGLLLKNCSTPPTTCSLPYTSVQTNFELYDCVKSSNGLPNNNRSDISCFTDFRNDSQFLNYSSILQSECRVLFSSLSVEAANATDFSLEVRVVKLGWWLDGACRCVEEADCDEVLSPMTRQGGFRCRCRDGFVGDGFIDGQGCTRESPECSASNFLSGKCRGGSGRWSALIGGIVAGVLLMVFGGLFFCYIRRRSSLQERRSIKKRVTEATGSIRIPMHAYREIEKATGGFSDKQRLGTGAYGTVYSGKLDNEEWVAIKRIKHCDTDSIEQVMTEIKLISSVCHPNLVRLLGCSIEKGEQILVYEYMPNGTLAEQLQRTRGHGLPWATRLNIATETARAIGYLHSHDPPIFHRDVKSSNILLDYNFKSKVADFGLSRLGEVESSHISTAPQGTPGYLDPQYHQSFQLSDKSDVYSFGVVLIEIITGLKVVDFARPQDEVNLATLATDRIGKGRLDEIIDPFLDHKTNPWTLSSIHKVAELAFRCLTFHRDMRPAMTEVLDELEQIRIIKFLDSDERLYSTSTSNLSTSSSLSNLSEKPLCIVIKNIAMQNRRWAEGNGTNSRNIDSPVSVQDSWLSDQGSPSTNSLLNNVIR